MKFKHFLASIIIYFSFTGISFSKMDEEATNLILSGKIVGQSLLKLKIGNEKKEHEFMQYTVITDSLEIPQLHICYFNFLDIEEVGFRWACFLEASKSD